MSFDGQAERLAETLFRDAERLVEAMKADDRHRPAVRILRDKLDVLLALMDPSRIVTARVSPLPPQAPLTGAPVDYLDV